MKPTNVIDVSELEPHVMDHRSPIWWGNVLLLCIETTMFAIVVASYFYLRQNFIEWPPPRVDEQPVLYHPAPDYGIATINVLLLLASCGPMFMADRAALHRNRRVVTIGMLICIVVGLVSIWLRFHEFSALKFRWDANA